MVHNSDSQKTIEILERALTEITLTDNHYDAFLFFTKLEELMSTDYSTILNKSSFSLHEDMIIKAKFIALYRLEGDEVINLISTKFNYINEIEGYSILDKIDFFLKINYHFFNDRNEFKEKLRNVLSESKTNISSKEIFINDEKVNSSIANWLKDFRNSYLENGFLDVLKVGEYIASAENIKSLSKKEKQRVETLIKLYAHLKLDSNHEGMEESFLIKNKNGELGRFERGIFTKIEDNVLKETYDLYAEAIGEDPKIRIKKDEQKLSPEKVFIPEEITEKDKKEVSKKEEQKSIEKLLASYQAFEIDLKSIESTIEDLGKYKNTPENLFSKFNNDLQKNKNRDNLLSTLVFVCQNKLLDKFLKENEELLLEFKKYLSFKLSDDIIKSIMNKSTSPETVSLYLQFLLFKKIKLSPKNAGLFGMHLANIFKKIGQDKYFPIVYGDVNLEQFVWREVIEDNGLVKFK